MTTCENDSLGRLVYMTTMALKNCLEIRLKPHDLTAEQFHVLKNLGGEGEVVQTRLCELVMKSPANMTRILDRLEKKGVVARRANPEDRRSILVSLTVAGSTLLATVQRELAGFEAEITRGLTAGRVEELKSGLRTVYENVVLLTRRDER